MARGAPDLGEMEPYLDLQVIEEDLELGITWNAGTVDTWTSRGRQAPTHRSLPSSSSAAGTRYARAEDGGPHVITPPLVPQALHTILGVGQEPAVTTSKASKPGPTREFIERIKKATAEAETIEEVTRLEHALKTGVLLDPPRAKSKPVERDDQQIDVRPPLPRRRPQRGGAVALREARDGRVVLVPSQEVLEGHFFSAPAFQRFSGYGIDSCHRA